jgi:hypothetical protein
MRALRAVARVARYVGLAVLQGVFVFVVGGLVPLLTFAMTGEAASRPHGPQWLPVVALGFGMVAFGVTSRWLVRARRRARAAWKTPPPPPPGQPMPEPAQQWPEMVGQATVRRLPDGSVLIEPTRGKNVA